MTIVIGSQGTGIESFPLANATHLRDLIWYDGPLLSLYEHEGQKYICSWVDQERDVSDTWYYYPISDVDYDNYLVDKLTLLDVWKRAAFFISVVCHASDKVSEWKVLTFNETPESVRPLEGSYISPILMPLPTA